MPSLIGTKPNQVPTNGDLGNMAFQDAAHVRVDNLTIDGASTLTGQVNIADKLHIGASTAPAFRLDVTGADSADGIRLWRGGERFKALGDGTVHWNGGSATTVGGTLTWDTNKATVRAGGALEFQTNNSGLVKMHIDTGGQVGIGVVPERMLDISGTGSQIQIRQPTGDYKARLFLATDGSFGIYSGPSASIAERIRIAPNGNVGIGAIAADYNLDVNGQAKFRTFTLRNNLSNAVIINDSAAAGYTRITAAGTSAGSISFHRTGTANSGDESMRIDTSGRMLVGTTAVRGIGSMYPQVEVEGTDAGTSALSITRNSLDAFAPRLILAKSRGTAVGSQTAVASGDILGMVDFYGANGTDSNNAAAQIRGVSDGTVSATAMPGMLSFWTTPAASTALNERMRINAAGTMLLGTTTDNGIARLQVGAGRIALDQDYHVAWHSLGTYRARITSDAGSNLIFETGSANTERMRIGAAGQLQIGTSGSTSGKLHILSNAANTSFEGTDHVYLQFYPAGFANGRKAYMGYAAANTAHFTLSNDYAGGAILFSAGGTRMIVGANGNVAIGASVAGASDTMVLNKFATGSTSMNGITNLQAIQSDVTGSFNTYNSGPSTQAATFTMSNVNHYRAGGVTVGAGSTVTTQIGFYANAAMTQAGTNIGFYGELAFASGRWNLYMAGDADNYIRGRTRFGSTRQISSSPVSISGYNAKTASENMLGLGSATGGANDFELIFTRSAAGAGAYYNIQSVEQGIAYRDITLNKDGGKVLVGRVAPIITEQFSSTGYGLFGGATVQGIIGDAGSGTVAVGAYSNHDLDIRTNNTVRMKVNAAGQVTITNQPRASITCHPYATTAETFAAAETRVIGIDTSWNTRTIHVNNGSHFSGVTGRFTAPIAGTYRVIASAASTACQNSLSVRKNGVTIAANLQYNLNEWGSASAEVLQVLVAGDYLDAIVYNQSATAGNLYSAQVTFELIG